MSRRDVFQAIADPSRRDIIELLSEGPLTVNAVARQFKLTRQAVSLHLKVLCECGVVHMHRQGRERICVARLEPMQQAAQWMQRFHSRWEQSMDKLDRYLYQLQTQEDKHGESKSSEQ